MIVVNQNDLKDPLINIAAATRLFAVKFATIPTGNEKTTFNMVKAYNTWSKEGTAYAEKAMQLYRQSK